MFLVGILLLTFPGSPTVEPEYARREWVARSFAAELGRGAVGGIGLERLVEMIAGGVGDGIWQSAVFDPVENCWYLPGWIDSAQAGSWRVALLLTPVPGPGKTHAWRFYLRCAGLVPFDQPAIEVEGAWREDDGGFRLAWADCSPCGRWMKNTQIMRVSRQKLLCSVRKGDARNEQSEPAPTKGSCQMAFNRRSPEITREIPDGGTGNALLNGEP